MFEGDQRWQVASPGTASVAKQHGRQIPTADGALPLIMPLAVVIVWMNHWEWLMVIDDYCHRCPCLPVWQARINKSYKFIYCTVMRPETSTKPLSTGAQSWCCDSWCYVNNSCPIAKQSWLGTGYYFSYETCLWDRSVDQIPWPNWMEFFTVRHW